MGSKFYKSDAVFPLQGVLLTTPKCIYLQCQILYLYFDCLLLQRTLLQKLNSTTTFAKLARHIFG